MRLPASLCIAVLLLGACGGISAESNTELAPAPNPTSDTAAIPDPTVPVTSTVVDTTVPPTTSSTTLSPGPATPADVDLVSYIEVIEHLLVGTTYEGMALEAPHVFLATGALFCDQLDAGTSSDRVLYDYIEALTGGPAEEASDDALTMAGAVLGSGLATMCPHHIATIGITE
ncbi:hypothetical protein ACFLRH_03805 [Actinomycetota bacterium]